MPPTTRTGSGVEQSLSVFTPEHLITEQLNQLASNDQGPHPWGCVWKPTGAGHPSSCDECQTEHVVLICSLVHSCGSQYIDPKDIVSTFARDNGLDMNRLMGTVRCLHPHCPNGVSVPSNDVSSISLSTLQSSLWITFRCDSLIRLRRSNFATMLDQYMSSLSPGKADTDSGTLDWNQLVQWERSLLVHRFGPRLTTLILQLTEFPVDVKRLSGSNEANRTRWLASGQLCVPVGAFMTRLIQFSYTTALVRFHLQNDGHTHRLRGLLPGSPIPGNELFGVSRAVLTETARLAYQPYVARPDSSTRPKHGPELAQTTTNPDTILTLLSAIQILFLLLSLLTPLHTIRPPPTQRTICSQESSFVHSELSTWMTSESDCTRIPTLGWFFLNTSEPDGFVMPSNPPPIVSVIELARNFSSESTSCGVFAVWNRWIEFITCELTRLLVWLESGEPAGLKINLHLARLMGHFFLYHIIAWRTYCSLLIHLAGVVVGWVQLVTEVHSMDSMFYANLATSACLMLGTLHVASSHPSPTRCAPFGVVLITYVSAVVRLTSALIFCLLLDLTNLLAVHLTTFYVYTVNLLLLQCRAIGAAWRLCRNGSKWNPLRNRVDTVPDMYVGPKIFAVTPTRPSAKQIQARVTVTDSGEHDVHLDRLFVATLLGLAVSLCLMPTTLAFYITFSTIRFLIVLVQNALRTCAKFVLDVPVSALLAWLFHTDLSRTELAVVVPPLVPTSIALTKLKLIRPSLTQAYSEHRLLHNSEVFGTTVPLVTMLRGLFTASEI